jgi:hypothetical protein
MLIRMARLLIFVCLFICSSAFGRAQEACSPVSQHTAAIEVDQLRQQLRSTKISKMDMDVPAAIQKQLTLLKAALAHAATSDIACHDTSVNPSIIEADLAHLLSANGPEPSSGSVSNDDPRYKQWLADLSIYGANLHVRVSKPSSSPQLLSVELDFNIACGDDTMLLLFEAQNGRWIEKLRWQASPYRDISGAFGNFFLSAILPGDSPQGWRAVVAHGMPSCASVWSAYRMDVLAPTAVIDRPRIVKHLQHGYNIGDGELKMTSTGNTLTLRLDVGTVESLQLVRPGIFRYTLTGDDFRRVAPIATNGRYFVDEWLQMPWSDAQHFSDPSALVKLKLAHAADNRRDDYGPVTACRDDKNHFQVALGDAPDATYYGIQQNGDGYTMLAASSSKPDRRCGGPDLMKKP